MITLKNRELLRNLIIGLNKIFLLFIFVGMAYLIICYSKDHQGFLSKLIPVIWKKFLNSYKVLYNWSLLLAVIRNRREEYLRKRELLMLFVSKINTQFWTRLVISLLEFSIVHASTIRWIYVMRLLLQRNSLYFHKNLILMNVLNLFW